MAICNNNWSLWQVISVSIFSSRVVLEHDVMFNFQTAGLGWCIMSAECEKSWSTSQLVTCDTTHWFGEKKLVGVSNHLHLAIQWFKWSGFNTELQRIVLAWDYAIIVCDCVLIWTQFPNNRLVTFKFLKINRCVCVCASQKWCAIETQGHCHSRYACEPTSAWLYCWGTWTLHEHYRQWVTCIIVSLLTLQRCCKWTSCVIRRLKFHWQKPKGL